MESIQQWFADGCNYADGVAIYGQLPRSNKNIHRLLSRKQNPANEEKLKYELKKLCDTDIKPVSSPVKVVEVIKQPTNVIEIVEATIKTAEKKQAIFFHQLPPELQPTLLEANILFKECCFLKVQLNDLPIEAEDEALALQLQISTKRKSNQLCWQKIDYWLAHKELPAVAKCEFDDMTPAQLLRKDQYLFQSISKLKKRVDQNKSLLKDATTKNDINRLTRAISKQEANILKQTEQQIKLKAIINGD